MKSQKPRRAVFFKVILAAVLTAVSGLGMLYVYQVAPTFTGVGVAWLAALGVAAGLFSRIVLMKHTGALRFTSALFSVVVGLWAADWITQGVIGFEILDFSHPFPDVVSLTELGIGWLGAVLTLRAWKKKPAKAVPQPEVRPEPAPKPVPAPRPASTKVQPVHIRLAGAAEKTQRRFRTAFAAFIGKITNWPVSRANLPVRLNLGSRVASEPAGHHMVIPSPSPRQSVAVSPAPPKPVAPKQIRKRKQKKDDKVKLVGAESHRCPFCLEDIDQNDPRGVKICPVCKTYHHADCWDVTGMCQIPHHQEL